MTTTEPESAANAGSDAPAACHQAPTTAPAGPHGYTANKDAHLKRLRRIEGQVRGLQRMVDEDEYCIDVLTQVSASTKALQSFALQLLEEHLRHCVADAATKGGEEMDAKVAEATAAIARLLRT
ncbi:metal-sensitive transcriptional regulator [Streptomyces sp. XM4193]|uniref:metal-sensitive transcriptional regulator n=1 Tax=Streptomyces sp. XM4193 TaxID=2929782 RepID=UPI001FFC23F2|nr:metal-sensitive transcriptional regulator [Streptomyces sp. XM4193]MCK1798228.1 metal-sensitive transcriptional regulator [Streptomyces sp. XM4193]